MPSNNLPTKGTAANPADPHMFYFFDDDGDTLMIDAEDSRALRGEVYDLLSTEHVDPSDAQDIEGNKKMEIPTNAPGFMVNLLKNHEGDVKVIVKKGDQFLGFVELVARKT